LEEVDIREDEEREGTLEREAAIREEMEDCWEEE
jgi:hypothetical protein